MHPFGLVALAELARSESRHQQSGLLAAADTISGAPHPSRWERARFRVADLIGRAAAIRQRSTPAVPLALPTAAPERAADLA